MLHLAADLEACVAQHLHEFCRAWHAAISAVSLHTVLLGDKDKVTKSTSPLVSYNSTHVTDIVEPGGGPGGSDRLFEAKVVSPCAHSPNGVVPRVVRSR